MIDKRLIKPLLFSLPILTGVFLGIAAIPSRWWFLNFVAFIPLLVASEWTISFKRPVWIFAFQLFVALVIFYLWVYLWVLKTANLAFIIGFLIILPFLLLIIPYIQFLKKGNRYSVLYFIAAWLSVELFQSYFQLGSPFYNLGHSLGAEPKIIQWYTLTGTAGGTLWILAVNFAMFSLYKTLISNRKLLFIKCAYALGLLIIPISISFVLFHTYKEKGRPTEVLIIHPSTDCSDVKYRINIYELMNIYLNVMLPHLSQNTEYVVLPETSITNAGWVSDLNHNLVFGHFNQYTKDFPNLKLITGAITYDYIPDVEKIKNYQMFPGIRYSKKYNVWYYTYNSALQIEKNRPVQMRVKEGLVPYQEYAPYPRLLPRLRPVGIDFQFSTPEKNLQVFTAANNKKTAAMICYELVYEHLFNQGARKKVEAFFVLLNEGWYLNAPKVPRQFLQLSVVRAIENRRSIAHSSNLGISAFINQRGEVFAKNQSKYPGFLKKEMMFNTERSLASILGNYIGVASFCITILLIFIEVIIRNI